MKKLPLLLCALTPAAFAFAQQPADKPLLSIPYSPSLDVTSMDKSADPCTDFYQYACGGWKKNNLIPPDQAEWDVYAKLSEYNQELLWGIALTDSKATNRTPVQQKVGDYFSACMDTAKVNALGVTPAKQWLSDIDNIRDREALRAYIVKAQAAGLSVFFGSGSHQDFGNAESVIVNIGAGGLGLPDRDYYLKTDAKSVEIRARYEQYVAQMLRFAGESDAQASADAKSILAFETALAEASLTRVERREPHNLYHMMTLQQLQQTSPAVNWPEFFAAIRVSPPAQVNVSQPKFLTTLSGKLSSEPLENLRAYLRFHLLNDVAPYLANDIETARFDFYSKYLRGVKEQPPRWKKCVREEDRYLGEALGHEFVRVAFSPEAKQATLRMTDQIETAMGQEIEKLDWMSPETKKQALLKLHNIRNKIGYPNKWRDYSNVTIKPDDYFGNAMRAIRFENDYDWNKVGRPLNRDEWGMSAPTVNAYFNGQMNDINFPAGVLQPPLYDVKSDDAPNYGDTGGTIGHELTHGFDDEGRQFDANGNLKDWWTDEDARKFTDRVQCIRDQYASYVVVDDIHINSKLTSGEDIADLGGELLAYIAWKAETENKQLHDEGGLTPDQRFFVGFAQWACENDRPENLRLRAMTDPHSPAYARVNGVVVNMPEFRKAFGCKVGQPMAPAKMCRVW